MKKFLAILLAMCLLTLWGCGTESTEATEPTLSTIPTTPEGDLVTPTRPEVNLIDPDSPALIVKISINPEFELVLNYTYGIASVTPLNADAEALLQSLDLEGKSYASGITEILEKAQELDLLKSGKQVTFSVKEVEDNAWTQASETILTKPLTEYREQSGGVFSYEFYPAGQVADPNNAAYTQVDHIAGEVHVLYFIGSAKVKTEITRPDGTYVVIHHLSKNERIEIDYLPDGTYIYHYVTATDYTSYTVYPDDRRETMIMKYDDLGRETWYYGEDVNGYTVEWFNFYEGERKVRFTIIEANGTQTEEIYYPNGTVAMSVCQMSDGTWERHYDEQGVLQTEKGLSPDGSTSLGVYKNGIIKTWTWTEPDGDYCIDTFREDGTKLSSVQLTDGHYYEDYYDENEVITSSFCKAPDGTEYHTVYENGNTKYQTVTHPDGTTETQYFESE